jgi:hypothetical protein
MQEEELPGAVRKDGLASNEPYFAFSLRLAGAEKNS